ncbi:hypothetical protein GQ55_7G117400 [Panicum hallii var. hallii]|uniref:Uncharacterized protein n=1 Tax=Panicum hallii var. hallii TaxID=1504633 RepID=A0A2T7CU57_9POAL|nr:hypothetical protein GQ55_7G117400 [Panicum hallii var. hallii]
MIIKSAKPTALSIMVILLVGIVAVDVQGNAEAEFTLGRIKTNNPTTFGDNIPNSSDKEKLKQLTTALGATTYTDHHILSREEYCKLFKCH